MRILLASDSFDPAIGGVQRVVKDLATTLLARGHTVEVLAPWSDGLAAREQIDGIDVHRVRLGRPALTARAIAGFARRVGSAKHAVLEVCRSLHPDVAHLHFLQSPLAYVLPSVCRRLDIPLVATAHGRDVVGSMIDGDTLGRRAVRRVLDRSTVVTAPSEATLADARALAPLPLRARFVAVPNALPQDFEQQLERDAPSAGEGVAAVGELHPKKGFDVLIRAVAALPGVRLRIAGRGVAHGALTALVDELGVSDRVQLVGFVPRSDLPAFLRSAAVQAVPSRREPFGLVIVEGFACGVPIVASRVGGIPEVIGDSAAAVLVPADDEKALASALGGLLVDGESVRERLVSAGRVRAAQLTVERTTHAYELVYAEAAGSSPPSAGLTPPDGR